MTRGIFHIISVLFVPWNFFKLNVLQDISTQYGNEPWPYYLTSTLVPCANLMLLYMPRHSRSCLNLVGFFSI